MFPIPFGGDVGGGVSPPTGGEMVVYTAVGTAATTSSANAIKANELVLKTTFIVETPYVGSGAGPVTVDVGYAGNLSALLSSGGAQPDVIPGVADSYNSAQPVVWANTDQAVVVTIGGAPVSGAGHVVVEHVVPTA